MFDQHVHSNFSFDSNEELENYINVSNKNDIVTTEHLDFANPIINYEDSSIEYLKYIEEITSLNKKYSNKFFSGIEIGYTPNSEKRIEDFLKDKNFNLKLLSIHQNGLYDYMCVNKKLISLEALIQEYFEQMIQALESSIEFNVLAHFEYGIRIVDISVTDFDSLARKFLNKIIDEEKLFISEKDNNFIINGDSEAIKDLEIFKDMNFEEIDFYIFYVNYLSKKEYENKKVLVGYNGIDGKEVTMLKFKEDINEIRDNRNTFKN